MLFILHVDSYVLINMSVTECEIAYSLFKISSKI